MGAKCSSQGSLFAPLVALVAAGIVNVNAFAAKPPYAETVILNGKVITADADKPQDITMAEAIAIQGDRIMAVGSNAEIRKYIADWTEVIDAKGNSVIPGLIDTHNHIYETSTGFPWVVKTLPNCLKSVCARTRLRNSPRSYTKPSRLVRSRSSPASGSAWVSTRPALR